jgi:hypothetical protein
MEVTTEVLTNAEAMEPGRGGGGCNLIRIRWIKPAFVVLTSYALS